MSKTVFVPFRALSYLGAVLSLTTAELNTKCFASTTQDVFLSSKAGEIEDLLKKCQDSPLEELPCDIDPKFIEFFRTRPMGQNDQLLTPTFEALNAHFSGVERSLTVLEVGAGWGRLSLALLSQLPQISSLYATDVCENVVKALPEHPRLVRGVFNATQIDSFPFKDQKFDAIVSNGAARYFNQSDISGLKQLLKPGGVCLITDFVPFLKADYQGDYRVPRLKTFYALCEAYLIKKEEKPPMESLYQFGWNNFKTSLYVISFCT